MNFTSVAASCASHSARCFFCSGVVKVSTGDSSFLSASAVLFRKAKRRKYSAFEIGSYLCVWHCAQVNDVPIHTAIVVFVRSTIAALRNSSSSVPPSLFVIVLRWNAVAMRCSSFEAGIQEPMKGGFLSFWFPPSSESASKSPASCSMVNWSNGMFALNARITQSRYAQIVRGGSSA